MRLAEAYASLEVKALALLTLWDIESRAGRPVRREKERETGREREREKKRERLLVIPSRFFLSCDNYPLFSARVRQARRTISTDRTAQKQGEIGNKFKRDFCLIYSL